MRLDNAVPHVDIVGGDSLRLLILRHDFESGFQVVFIDDFNLFGLRVLEETVVELQEFVWLNAHFWHNTLGFDWHCKHILANAFQVNDKHHVIDVRHTRYEFDYDLCSAVLG